jgi:hypothetical protein
MKIKAKLLLLALGVGSVVMQLGNCAQFWGDVAGDALWLGAVD